MGSEGSCPPPCQKLIICSGCGGQGLLVQNEAQKLWLHQGNSLSAGFCARQMVRCSSLRILINEIFIRIGHPAKDGMSLKELGHDLLIVSKTRGLSDEDNAYCIERADQCEEIIEENQRDYLSSIGYQS